VTALLPAGVVTVVPIGDGPWRMVVLDRVAPCSTRGCQRHPFARFRWYDVSTGELLCGVCRFARRGTVPERLEPTPVRLPDDPEQLTIEVPE
jgi:hypothetical protein